MVRAADDECRSRTVHCDRIAEPSVALPAAIGRTSTTVPSDLGTRLARGAIERFDSARVGLGEAARVGHHGVRSRCTNRDTRAKRVHRDRITETLEFVGALGLRLEDRGDTEFIRAVRAGEDGHHAAVGRVRRTRRNGVAGIVDGDSGSKPCVGNRNFGCQRADRGPSRLFRIPFVDAHEAGICLAADGRERDTDGHDETVARHCDAVTELARCLCGTDGTFELLTNCHELAPAQRKEADESRRRPQQPAAPAGEW